eukprot:126554-Karenia_brevis.AAC.1
MGRCSSLRDNYKLVSDSVVEVEALSMEDVALGHRREEDEDVARGEYGKDSVMTAIGALESHTAPSGSFRTRRMAFGSIRGLDQGTRFVTLESRRREDPGEGNEALGISLRLERKCVQSASQCQSFEMRSWAHGVPYQAKESVAEPGGHLWLGFSSLSGEQT